MNDSSNNIFLSGGKNGFEKTKEIWLPIPNYEGLYEISNLKRIRSLNRVVSRNIKDKILLKKLKGKIIKSTNGYSVNLSKDNRKERVEIDRMYHKCFNNTSYGKHEKIEDGRLIHRREYTSNAYIGKEGCSKYTGVTFNKKYDKWTSKILIGKDRVYLGVFESEYDAALMYQKAVKNIHLYKGIPKYFRSMLNQVYLSEEEKNIITVKMHERIQKTGI